MSATSTDATGRPAPAGATSKTSESAEGHPPRGGWLFDGLFVAAAAGSSAWNELAQGHASTLSKLVPMGLLIGLVSVRLRRREIDRTMGVALLAGLIVSAVGDVVIVYRFVAGIAAFLLAHLAYLRAMGRPRGPLSRHALSAIPAVLVGGTMAWILVGGDRVPGPLLAPVIVYMTIISAMLGRAAGRAAVDVRTRESRLLLAGAAVFVASDALIALGKWVVTIPFARAWILVTYFAAQRLIVAGAERARASGSGEGE